LVLNLLYGLIHANQIMKPREVHPRGRAFI
jgi:hypothetical protein